MSLGDSKAAMLLRVYQEATYLVVLISPTPCLPDRYIILDEDPDLKFGLSRSTHLERWEVIQAHFAKINSLADS